MTGWATGTSSWREWSEKLSKTGPRVAAAPSRWRPIPRPAMRRWDARGNGKNGVVMAKTLEATQIGTKAETLLRHSGLQWEIVAAVSGAVYIIARNGELIWLTDQASALHPRAILLRAMPPDVPETGSSFESNGDSLRCESFTLGWQRASRWAPTWITDARAIGAGGLGQAIDAIERVLSKPSDRESTRDGGASSLFERQLVEAAGHLRRVSKKRGVLAGLQAVSGIVGLGQGLTPQGDDLLGGYLFTLHAMDASGCLSFQVDWGSVTTWLHSVAHCTNAISHILLADHAHGDSCAPLVAFIHGVLKGEVCERLDQLASDVVGIGASSGRSLLEGVQSACHVARSPRTTEQKLLADELRKTFSRPARREVARVR